MIAFAATARLGRPLLRRLLRSAIAAREPLVSDPRFRIDRRERLGGRTSRATIILATSAVAQMAPKEIAHIAKPAEAEVARQATHSRRRRRRTGGRRRGGSPNAISQGWATVRAVALLAPRVSRRVTRYF